MTQLRLDVEPPGPNPNAHLFGPDGKTPARALWCGDTPRLGGPCPFGGHFPARANLYDPHGGACCKTVAASR